MSRDCSGPPRPQELRLLYSPNRGYCPPPQPARDGKVGPAARVWSVTLGVGVGGGALDLVSSQDTGIHTMLTPWCVLGTAMQTNNSEVVLRINFAVDHNQINHTQHGKANDTLCLMGQECGVVLKSWSHFRWQGRAPQQAHDQCLQWHLCQHWGSWDTPMTRPTHWGIWDTPMTRPTHWCTTTRLHLSLHFLCHMLKRSRVPQSPPD